MNAAYPDGTLVYVSRVQIRSRNVNVDIGDILPPSWTLDVIKGVAEDRGQTWQQMARRATIRQGLPHDLATGLPILREAATDPPRIPKASGWRRGTKAATR